jgi:hypothetical protein
VTVVEQPEEVQHSPSGRVRHPIPAAHIGGWVGLGLGLVNVYPTLFPWVTAADKGVGVLVCLLVTAVVARTSVLAARSALDWPLVLLVSVLILIAAVVIVVASDHPAGPSGGAGAARAPSAQVRPD